MAIAPIMTTSIVPIRTSVTVNANTTVARGLRMVINTDGTYSLAGATVRGDVVCETTSGTAGGNHLVTPLQVGGHTGVVVGVATVAVGDGCYSAASGLTTNVSTNAVLIGKFLQAGVNTGLAMVALENPL